MRSNVTRLLSLAAILSACGGAPDSPEVDAQSTTISLEEFEARSTREFEGRKIYLIEGDLPVSHDELVEYYYRTVVRRDDEFATDSSALAVNRVGNTDDIWNLAQRFN